MGMDRAIHVVVDEKDTATLEPLAVAKLFAKIAEEENPDIILLGKQVRGWKYFLSQYDLDIIIYIQLTSSLFSPLYHEIH